MSSIIKSIRLYLFPILAITLGSSLLFFFLHRQGTLKSVELKTLDMRFVTRGEREYGDEDAKDVVKVIQIDAKTVGKVGRWPWPRGVFAKLVSGVCGESYDFGEFGVDDEGWEDVPENETEEEPAAEPENEDSAPRGEIGAQNVLGIDVLFDREERDYAKYLLREGGMMDPEEQDAMAVEAISRCEAVVHISLMKFLEGKSAEAEDLGLGDQSQMYEEGGEKIVYNVPLENYQTPNSRMGFANMLTSVHDGRVRKARLYYELGGEYVFSFALMSLASFLGVEEEDIKVEEGLVTVGPYGIPVDGSGEIYINYRGREYEPDESGLINKENVYSALDVMENPDMLPLLMQGKYIFLIGVTDPELKDIFYTPFATAMDLYPNNETLSGVEVHKEIIDTILQGEYLRDMPGSKVFLLLFAGALLVAVLTVFKLWLGIAGMAAYGGVHVYFAFDSFHTGGAVYPVFVMLLVLPVSFAASILYRNLVVDREKRAVKNIFRSYVAPHVLADLMENPGDLRLGGHKSKVTVLFSDIRGFTTISERLAPEVLIRGLNHYLSEMTRIILDNSGMVDKFIGDAVMAVWGAPVPSGDDAKKAVSSAIRMGVVLGEINPRIKELCGLEFAIGVGLNTGEATLGNIGSEGKLDYTVIGDTVNLASRLEGLTKQYGAFAIISENTYQEVRGDFDCRLLDNVRVKGKDEPVGIYQAFCEKGKLDDDTGKMIGHYNAGLECYHERKWDEAADAFEKALAVMDDKASRLYIERCEHFRANPPPPDWDGTFAWKTK